MRFDKLTIKSQEALQQAQGQCSSKGQKSFVAMTYESRRNGASDVPTTTSARPRP